MVAGTLAVAAAALGRRRRSAPPDATSSRENKHGKRERERRRGEIVCACCRSTLLACERAARAALTTYAGASSSSLHPATIHSSHLLSHVHTLSLHCHSTLLTEHRPLLCGLRIPTFVCDWNASLQLHPELFVEPSGHSLPTTPYPPSPIHHRLPVKHRHHVSRRELGQVQE